MCDFVIHSYIKYTYYFFFFIFIRFQIRSPRPRQSSPLPVVALHPNTLVFARRRDRKHNTQPLKSSTGQREKR